MRLFRLGLIVTSLYFILIGVFIWLMGLTKVDSWNELGDFLAGVFSPVAFLWLVLGYLQQQKELQQNTEALKLQADELKNSVEQYREMVAVSKQQLKNDSLRAMADRDEREKELRPDLYMSNLSWSMKSNGMYEYNWIVNSDGKDAKNIQVEFEPPIGEYRLLTFRNNKSPIQLPRNKVRVDNIPEKFQVTLSYESALGYSYVSEYTYELHGDGKYELAHSADYQGSKI